MLSSRPIQPITDGPYFPTKTPARGLKNRIENANAGAGVAISVNGKGKHANAFPKTPFQNSSIQPHTGKQRIHLATTRPLGDKTPLPNRYGNNNLFETPLLGKLKPSKLGQNGENGNGTPDSMQRPSSMRKHIKHPRNSGKFETPVNTGNHWDISDGEIVVPDAQPETIVEDVGEDIDEIEYGPPNTLNLPYQLPFDFDLPDYKQVGKSLFQLAHSVPFEDVPEPELTTPQLETITWDMIPLPALESDDPFYLARLESSAAVATKGATNPIKSQSRSVIKAPPAPLTKLVPRVTATRSTGRIPPSNSASSQKAVLTPALTTRSNSVASTRLPSRTIVTSTIGAKTTVPSKPVPKPRDVTCTLPLAQHGSKTVVGDGVKPPLTKALPTTTKRTEVRRPHTSIALMRNTKVKAPAKGPADIDKIVFDNVSLGIDDLDFKFDV